MTNSQITRLTSTDDVHVCPSVAHKLLNLAIWEEAAVGNFNQITSQHVVPCLGQHLQEGHDDGEHHPEVDQLHGGRGRQRLGYAHEAERTW